MHVLECRIVLNMKITELITRLEELKEKHGDVEVLRTNYDDCGETLNLICDVSYEKDPYGDEWVVIE